MSSPSALTNRENPFLFGDTLLKLISADALSYMDLAQAKHL